MERPKKTDSDDDHSLPAIQLNAVTEALLAEEPRQLSAPQRHEHLVNTGPQPGTEGRERVKRVVRISNWHLSQSIRGTSASRLRHQGRRSGDDVPDLNCSPTSGGSDPLRVRPRRRRKQGDSPSHLDEVRTPEELRASSAVPVGDGLARRGSAASAQQVLAAGKQSTGLVLEPTDVSRRQSTSSRGSLARHRSPSTKPDAFDEPESAQNPTSTPDANYLERTPAVRLDKFLSRCAAPKDSAQKVLYPANPKLPEPPSKQLADPAPQAGPRDALCDKREAPAEKRRTLRRINVNGESYTISRKLGKGGSGRVFEVISSSNQIWALKTIPLQTLDPRMRRQIENEVALLKSLRDAKRVVFLKDWAINDSRKTLYIVMELGQLDLENIIKEQNDRSPALDLAFVGYYWLEMLRCVASIHNLDVVHSDIKPANFVLVSGVLKLVDFGIANTLSDDTVNVYQDHQAGTPNYMAPETLRALSNAGQAAGNSRLVRFGKPSDVWSLGCVLYQLIYGRPPFGHFQGLPAKVMAISNPSHVIDFPAKGRGDVDVPGTYLSTMRACLARNPAQRATAAGLLGRSSDGLVQIKGGGVGGGRIIDATPRAVQDMVRRALTEAGREEASVEDVDALVQEVMGQLRHGL